MSGQRHVAPREPGRHAGPQRTARWARSRITATRIILLVAVAGSVGYLAYAITVRDATQIPMLASGAAVLGIVFSALAIAGAIETMRAARDDRPGRSVAAAVFGGLAGDRRVRLLRGRRGPRPPVGR